MDAKQLFEMLGRATAEAQLLREALAKAQARIAELEGQAVEPDAPEGKARH